MVLLLVLVDMAENEEWRMQNGECRMKGETGPPGMFPHSAFLISGRRARDFGFYNGRPFATQHP
jgi:hypothetical protein